MSIMNKQHSERQELARRYTRGELSEQEAEEFEIYLMDKPEMIEQLELDEVFHNCLEEAEEKRVERFSIWKWITQTPIGASVATFACTTGLLFGILVLDKGFLKSSPNISATGNIIYLENLRSNNPGFRRVDVVGNKPTLALFVQTSLSENKQVTITLSDNSNTFHKFEGFVVGGELVVNIPSTWLHSGDYEITVSDNEKVIFKSRFGVNKY